MTTPQSATDMAHQAWDWCVSAWQMMSTSASKAWVWLSDHSISAYHYACDTAQFVHHWAEANEHRIGWYLIAAFTVAIFYHYIFHGRSVRKTLEFGEKQFKTVGGVLAALVKPSPAKIFAAVLSIITFFFPFFPPDDGGNGSQSGYEQSSTEVQMNSEQKTAEQNTADESGAEKGDNA